MSRAWFATAAALVGAFFCLGGCGGDERPDARRIVLSYSANPRPYMPAPEEVAKQVASDLEDVGFTVELRKHDWTPYLSHTKRGDHQMALFGWSADIPDVDNFLYVLLDKLNARPEGAQNISFYTDDAVHQLLEKARYTYDDTARNVLYRDAQERILADAPMVPLAFSDRVLAHRRGVGPLTIELITHSVLARVTAPKDGRIVFGRGGDASRLDPARITDGESSLVTEQIYDTLVRYRPGGIEVEPGLALSWTHDEDRRTWRFRLRDGVQFHDGTVCDAAAVVNAFERQRDPNHRHHQPNIDYWGDLLPFVTRVEVGADPLEVVFRCERASPSFFLPTLAVFAFGIPSPTALERHGADFARHPVGTGPFRFVSWEAKSEIVIARNPSWWGGPVALEQVVFRVLPDANARSQALRSAAVDVIDNVALTSVPQLEGDGAVVVLKEPGMHVAYLSMHVQKAPFTDQRVREAVALALDKRRIVQAGWEGRAQPAVTPVPPNLPGHANDLKDRVRDVTRARRLLDEALGPRR